MVDMTNSARGRAQSEVLGTVMLLGIVIMASLVVAGIAMGAFGGTQDQADREAIERTLLDFRSSAVDVAIEGETQRTMPLDLPEGADFSLDAENTSFKIEHLSYYDGDAANETEELYHLEDIGTAEVEYGDVRYGMQAGGVFALEDDRGTLVAPPNMGYRGLTANLPLLRVNGSKSMVNPTELRLSQGEHVRPVFPDPDEPYEKDDIDLNYTNPVMNGTIKMTVEGPYYEGWYEYFIQYTDGNVTRNDEHNRVTAFVESIDELNPDAGIVHYNGFHRNGNPDYDDDKKSDFIPDVNQVVESHITGADEADEYDCEGDGELSDCKLEGGETYYFPNDVEVNEDITIDVTDGDVDIVVNGSMDFKGNDITVTGDEEHGVVYYLDGGLDFQGGTTIGTADEAVQSHRNVFLSAVEDEIAVDQTPGAGNSDIEAVIIAPYAELEFAGNVNIHGSVWAHEVTLSGGKGSSSIHYDEGLDDQGGIDISGTQTPVMFLHLTENTVVVEG